MENISKAVDHLESLFTQAEADLDLMSKKLELRCSDSEGTNQQPNPVRLMKKVNAVKEEAAAIGQEISSIMEQQREFSDYFRTQGKLLVEMMKKLESSTGVDPEQDATLIDACQQMSSLLGIPDGDLEPYSDTPSGQSNAFGLQEESKGAVASSTTSTSVNGSQKTESPKEEETNELQSLAALRLDGNEFVEVAKEEFLSVSELIRQRVKLEEVNKVYSMLWQFFKEENNEGVLTPKDMSSKGFRVNGATGQAKLKVLRALKIIQISKNGDVKLL